MVEIMEMQNTFKKTEVGGIPSDWDIDEVQNVANITTGAKNTQDRISGGAFPFFVRSQTIERINSYSFDGEAVLTAGDGVGTGKVFHYINGKFDFHQRVYKISGFSEERLDGYFFYLYFSKNFYNRIMQMTAKSSVDSVRREMIAKMLIPLPRKTEQTAIATTLNDADVLITQLEKLIAKKRAIKQGTMQELLKPKEGWEVKKLGELGSFKGGSGFPIKDQGKKEEQIPFYKVSDMNLKGNEIFLSNSNNWISEQTAKQISAYCFPSNTIVFAKIGAAIFLERKKILSMVSCIDNNMMGYIVNTKAHLKFIYFLFHNIKISSYANTTALPSINGKDLSDIEIRMPLLSEQIRIAQILSDMDTEIEALEKKLDKYKMLKQGMMQNLLTGKIRLI